MDLETVLEQAASVWVFGYGSLTWKPDFSYSRKEIGFIKGFKRRFWQGNVTHRGTKERIGRVATLIPARKGKVWGVAFEIKGKDAIVKALGGLTTREITLGGYDVKMTPFHPRDSWTSEIPVILYMATKDNSLFLGEADTDRMATEIALAKGAAGSNTEYVTRLADYIRKYIPEDRDDHLFALDKRVREIFNNRSNHIFGVSVLFESKFDDVTDNSNSNTVRENTVKMERSLPHEQFEIFSSNQYHLDTNTRPTEHHHRMIN